VGAALAHEESWCGLIVDGHHVQKPGYLLTVENGKFVPMAKIDS